MKLRTTLGTGLAAAAVASTVLGTTTPALAVTAAPWNTQVGAVTSQALGLAVSTDGSTAFALASGAYDVATDSMGPTTVTPVDLSTGTAGTVTSFSPSYTVGSPAADGDVVAVAGYDGSNTPTVWTADNGTATAVTLPGDNVLVGGVTATADGFLVAGQTGGCLETWTFAPGDTTATAAAPVCADSHSYTVFRVATQEGTGTVYAAVTDYGADSTTQELWNLSDTSAAPVALPDALGSPTGLTVTAGGTAYVTGSGANDNTYLATVDLSDTSTIPVRGVGLYPGASNQIGVVDGHLWITGYEGIAVLDPAGTASYTTDAPAPVLVTDQGAPQFFDATAGADHLLLPSDAAFADTDSNAGPGLQQVIAPAAPAPSASVSGTTATVSWDGSSDGGTAITSATVTATDTTTGTALTPITAAVDGSAPSVDVPGLTRGDTYTFSVVQDNGFFTSTGGTTTPVTVVLPATPKPSRVAITGTPAVGTRLTIRTTGSWGTGASLTYAWYAGTTKVATTSSYTPKAADAGKKIKVAVTGTSAGHSPSTVTSAYVGPVTKPVYKVPSRPTITGTPKVGKILTAHITGLPKTATVKFQWAYNGGQYGGPIGHPTTSTTLKVPASVRGTRIEVIALVTVPGYATGSAMSAVTARVS